MIDPDHIQGSEVVISFEVGTLVKAIIKDILESLTEDSFTYEDLYQFIMYDFLQYNSPGFLREDSFLDMPYPPQPLEKSYLKQTWDLLFKEGRTIYLWSL